MHEMTRDLAEAYEAGRALERRVQAEIAAERDQAVAACRLAWEWIQKGYEGYQSYMKQRLLLALERVVAQAVPYTWLEPLPEEE